MAVDVLGIADGCCAGRGGHVDLGAFVLLYEGTEGVEFEGDRELWGFRFEKGGQRGRGGQMGF